MKILAGPLLRRVETKAFYVWFCLDQKPKTISANVFAAGKTLNVRCTPQFISLGPNCYCCLIRISRRTTFPKSVPLEYEVLFDAHSSSNVSSYADACPPISYHPFEHPMFVIPTRHTRIAQASCRKLHAQVANNGDALSLIDEQCAKAGADITQRPTMLVLTGDQIYADDVATGLLHELIEIGRRVTGRYETLPGLDRWPPHKRKLRLRDAYLTPSRGFTTDHRSNHLVTFGEFAAMYLVAFGGIGVNLPTFKTIAEKISRGMSIDPRIRQELQTEYNSEKRAVENCLSYAWRIRRLMANTPTYMMFDDHEVSDDWNTTRENRNQFQHDKLSRRVAANALAAYWVFQGWGNDPKAFSPEFVDQLQLYFDSYDDINGVHFEDTLLKKEYGCRWGYEIPGSPYLVALDTRTDRVYPSKSSSCRLMSLPRIRRLGDRLAHIGSRMSSMRRNQETLLLLSPAPLIGLKAIELIQLGVSRLGSKAQTRVDAECWAGDTKAVKALYAAVKRSGLRTCTILSGDVHYAYVAKHVHRYGQDMTFYQVTSSATHNAPSGKTRVGLKALSRISRLRFLKSEGEYLMPRGTNEIVNGDNSCCVVHFSGGQPIEVRKPYFHGGHAREWHYHLTQPRVLSAQSWAHRPTRSNRSKST